MNQCPHCNKETISNAKKLLSVFFGPTTCPSCQQHSYVHIFNALKAISAWIVLTWLFIGLAYLSQASIILLGSIPAIIVVVNKFIIQAPLLPRSTNS